MRPFARRASSDTKALPWLVVGCLLLGIGVVYGQTLGFGFLNYDDQLFVTDCPPVRAGLTRDGVVWAFTNGPAGEWYPLSMFSHMLDCQLYGLNPAGHFLSNLLLHAGTVIALFLVLRQMTGELWPSALVAALLAIHPQHVESVAWIAERRDVLSGLFFALTLAAYLGYVRTSVSSIRLNSPKSVELHNRSSVRYLLTAVLLALGLMSKSMLVTVPPLLLLLDYWPLGRYGHAIDPARQLTPRQPQSFAWLVVEKLPLLAIALADCVMTLASHAKGTLVVSWSERISNASVSVVTYLVHCFYPVGLAAFYPVQEQPVWKVVGSLALLGCVSLAAVLGRRRYPYCFVGWFWFVGMLIPVMGLIQVSDHAMADRYMYLPAIGLYIALAWGAWRWAAGAAQRVPVLGVSAVAVLVLLTACAERQTSYWRDQETLWTHTISVAGESPKAEIALAETMRASGRLNESVEHYRRAVEMADKADLFNNFGSVLLQLGRFDDAGVQFRRGLLLAPNSALLLGNLGAVLASQGKPEEAIPYYSRAIEADRTLVDPYLNMVRLLAKRRQFNEAIVFCRQALQVDPTNNLARRMLVDLEKARSSAPGE